MMGILIGPEYVTFRSDPNNDHITDGEWCGKNKLLPQELVDWKKRTPDGATTILKNRRARYAEMISDVDKAVFDKAKEGHVQSAELIYRRFENWTPRQADEALKRSPNQKTFAQLIAEDDEEDA